jgi:hypothetical protein
MRAIALCAAAIALPACIYYDPGPQPEQADAIIFYPPDAGTDGPPPVPFDPSDCSTANEKPCPDPSSPDGISVCGRIYDVETGAQVTPGIIGEVCRDGVTDGACVLDIEPYDALAYAQDTSIAPQSYASKYMDSCGRFQLVDVINPSLGFLGLGIDDRGATDDYGIGGAAFATNDGERVEGMDAFAVRHATDASWTSAAGLTGDSFVERGVILMAFFDAADQPADGVIVTEGTGPEVDNDYYFSDTTTETRRTLAPLQAATGANGSALKINSALVEHSGTGGGCTNWSSALATAIRGVMLYAPRECQ